MTPPGPSRSLGGLNLHFTKLSRVFAGILVAGYLAQLIAPSSRQYLALVPGRFIPCVWNIFTAGLLETSIWRLTVSAGAILLLARMIEPAWGTREFSKFASLVNGMTGACTLVFLYIIYVLNPYASEKLLYAEVCGAHGVVAACLVAVKQIMPDHEVTLLAMIKFRAKYLPSFYVVAVLLVSIILGGALNNIPTVLLATYFAWAYLRFLQTKPELAVRGDPSPEFRFATFFPDMVQPWVDEMAAKFVQVIPLGGEPAARLAPGYGLAAATLPGSETSDATRRRERGARALEDRMKKAAAGRTVVVAADDVEATPAEPDV